MRTFLKAEWLNLAMANYAIAPQHLIKYLPAKTEIDFWNNTCYVSLVGFMFCNTRVLGLRIPGHIDFEEVNLRFYVRYKDAGVWKRGVVFVKEIVPRAALTFIANTLYNENYETMPMKHFWDATNNELSIEYCWKKRDWNRFKVLASTETSVISSGSEEEFITEHYWGYTKVSPEKTLEYKVEHPSWNVHKVHQHEIAVNFQSIYGADFAFLQDEKPKSVFLAEGSEIIVNTASQL